MRKNVYVGAEKLSWALGTASQGGAARHPCCSTPAFNPTVAVAEGEDNDGEDTGTLMYTKVGYGARSGVTDRRRPRLPGDEDLEACRDCAGRPKPWTRPSTASFRIGGGGARSVRTSCTTLTTRAGLRCSSAAD